MALTFVKPSMRRVVGATLLVVVIACLLTGTAVAIGSIAASHDQEAAPTGEYVRLVVLSLVMWGPIYLLTAWPVSAPTIVVLGLLAACLRSKSVATNSQT